MNEEQLNKNANGYNINVQKIDISYEYNDQDDIMRNDKQFFLNTARLVLDNNNEICVLSDDEDEIYQEIYDEENSQFEDETPNFNEEEEGQEDMINEFD